MTSLARTVLGAPDAPTVVLLHGITSAAVVLSDAAVHFAELGYRVVAADTRGHGLSPRWTPEQLTDPGEVLVRDAIVLLETIAAEIPEGGRMPVLIGHSMGGATAMVAAGRRPDLVSGVVLEDPAPCGWYSQEDLHRRGADRVTSRRRTLADPVAATHALIQDGVASSPGEALAITWADERSDENFLATGVIFPDVPIEEGLRALQVPTLLVTGDAPGSLIREEGIELLAQVGNENLSFDLVPGAAHCVRREQPAHFHAAVDPFVERCLRG